MKHLLSIHRDYNFSYRVSGCLYFKDKFFGFTLEDAIRPIKIKKHTAIAEGSCFGIVSYSPRFKREMIMLYTDKETFEHTRGDLTFKGIRIHSGVDEDDTDGCVLLGENRELRKDGLLSGFNAERELVKLIKEEVGNQPFLVSIGNFFKN